MNTLKITLPISSALKAGLKKLGARSYRAPNVHLSIQYGARIFVHL